MKTLVVFYSAKGYVRSAALEKAKEEDADILELETTENYLGFNGFPAAVLSAVKKKRVTLFPYDNDIESYDKVIICAPVWCGSVCTPVREFITREKHHISRTEYVIYHAMPGVCLSVADEMDTILRLKRERTTDVHCICGKQINVTVYPEEVADDD